MFRNVLLLTGAILFGIANAAPVRSAKDWSIHPQLTSADWGALVQPGNLAAGRLVQSQPMPNDANTGSDLKQLTDGVLAGAEGRM